MKKNQNESISESNRIKYIFFSGLLKNFLGLKKVSTKFSLPFERD